MKISIITVCFNSANTLERTIRSVISQNYTDLEYIIIDGGSTDGTIDIIEKYKENISLWISEPDDGIFDAMNKGISKASGEIIGFINSDDYYQDNAFNIVYNSFKDSNCDCVCFDNYVVNENGVTELYDASNYIDIDMYTHMIYFHSAMFAKSSFFNKKDNFNLRYRIAADYDWVLNSMQKGMRLLYIHRPIFTFTYGGVSSTNVIECAAEARNIALLHLPTSENNLTREIEKRYGEIVATAGDKQRVKRIAKKILPQNKPIVIWGLGTKGIQCLEWIQSLGIEVIGCIDTNTQKQGQQVRGLSIYSPVFLKELSCNLIIASDRYAYEICEEAMKIACREVNYYPIYNLWIEIASMY